MRANRPSWIVLGIVVALPLLALAWWLGSPLFLDKTVSEDFPAASSASLTGEDGAIAAEPVDADEMMDDEMVDDEMVDDEMVDDEMGDEMDSAMDGNTMDAPVDGTGNDSARGGDSIDTPTQETGNDIAGATASPMEPEMEEDNGQIPDGSALAAPEATDDNPGSDTGSHSTIPETKPMPEPTRVPTMEATAVPTLEPTPVPTPEPTPEPTPSEPVVLLQGAFRDVDSVHRGSGSATVYALPDGSRVLRFEQFNVTNGPDLYVTLVPHPDPQSEAEIEGYVELGRLKGNAGDQNYDLPADLELSPDWSVVIWCKAFNVNFSVAPLG